MAYQVRSVLGSNTTHGVPRAIDSSRNMNERRTFTYFESMSDVLVCAPE